MIAVCQNVALSAEDKLLMRHRLRKHNILMKVFPNQVGSHPVHGPSPAISGPSVSPRRGTSDPVHGSALVWGLSCRWGPRRPSGCTRRLRGPGTEAGGSSCHSSAVSPSPLLSQVLKPFLEDSKYQNLLPLFVGHTMLLVSEEPKVKEMVRILRGVPFLPLLGEPAPLPVGGGRRERGCRSRRRHPPGAWREPAKPWTSLERTPVTDGAGSTAQFAEGCLCLPAPVPATAGLASAPGRLGKAERPLPREGVQTPGVQRWGGGC